MAAPAKFEKKKEAILKFISDTNTFFQNTFFQNTLDWLDCNGHFLWFKVIFLLKWRFPWRIGHKITLALTQTYKQTALYHSGDNKLTKFARLFPYSIWFRCGLSFSWRVFQLLNIGSYQATSGHFIVKHILLLKVSFRGCERLSAIRTKNDILFCLWMVVFMKEVRSRDML